VQHCQTLPGEELFATSTTTASGRRWTGDVNAYLREIAGREITARTSGTWAGTMHAAHALRDLGPSGERAKRTWSRRLIR
jgi:DNA topoisomerase-1